MLVVRQIDISYHTEINDDVQNKWIWKVKYSRSFIQISCKNEHGSWFCQVAEIYLTLALKFSTTILRDDQNSVNQVQIFLVRKKSKQLETALMKKFMMQTLFKAARLITFTPILSALQIASSICLLIPLAANGKKYCSKKLRLKEIN